MTATVQDVLGRFREDGIERVELKVGDLRGHWHAIGLDAHRLGEDAFRRGVPIDATGVEGWPALLPRELTVMPDPATAWIDPFLSPRTLSLIGSFQGPQGGGSGAAHCPRSLSRRALAHLAGSGLADAALFGSEPEFVLFRGGGSASLPWGGPSRLDAGDDLSAALGQEVLLTLGGLGVRASHGQGAPGPCLSLWLDASDLLRASDAVMLSRYVVRQVARRHGLSASFMPRPTAERVCAGMAVHQSLWKAGHPLFYGQGTYGGLSQTARWYVGGLLRHGPSLAAFTNPGTNSYRRLRGGPEAPTRLSHGRDDPAAVVALPEAEDDPAARRVVLRQSDGLANPYLAFSAMLLAGLDGLRRQIDPGPPGGREPQRPATASPCGAASLPQDLSGALEALSDDRDYLLVGGVFSPQLLEDWIALKRREVEELEHHPHPHEFSVYPQA